MSFFGHFSRPQCGGTNEQQQPRSPQRTANVNDEAGTERQQQRKLEVKKQARLPDAEEQIREHALAKFKRDCARAERSRERALAEAKRKREEEERRRRQEKEAERQRLEGERAEREGREEEERRQREEEEALELATAHSHAARVSKEAWEDALVPPLTTPREGFAAVATSDGQIWVLGGYHRVNYLSCGERILLMDTGAEGVQVAAEGWKPLPNGMQSSRNWFGAAALATSQQNNCDDIGGDQVVVVGGYNPRYLKTAEVLDTTTHEWTFLPALNTPRRGCSVSSFAAGGCHFSGKSSSAGNDCVYVVGGSCSDEGQFCNTVEYYRPGFTSWKYLSSPMSRRRLFCCSVLLQMRDSPQLLVMGGQVSSDDVTNAVEAYDFGSGQWTDLPPMNQARSEFAAVAMGPCIYVMGGYSSAYDDNNNNNENPSHRTPLSSVELYDARTQEWKVLPQRLTMPRAECAAVVVHGMIVLIGGRSERDARLCSVEVLKIGDDLSFDIFLPELPTIASSSLGRQGRAVALEDFCQDLRQKLSGVERDTAKTQQCIDDGAASQASEAQDLYDSQRDAATASYDQGMARLRAELQSTLSGLERERQQTLNRSREGAQRQTRVLQERTAAWRNQARDQLEQAQEELHALQSAPPLATAPLDPSTPAAQDKEPPKPPDQLVCPLTREVMVDPVMTIDGQTYERAAIEHWFANFQEGQEPTSPGTNVQLGSRLLFPNVSIKSLCDEYRKTRGVEVQ